MIATQEKDNGKNKEPEIIELPADPEKVKEQQERWNRENEERIENFAQIGHKFYKETHKDELEREELLSNLRAIECFLEKQLENVRAEIRDMESEE